MARILIVDDDDGVLAMYAKMLRTGRYEVVAARGSLEALKLLDSGIAVDLLITDVVMPGMSGPELAREVRLRRPSIPILFITALSDDPMARPEAIEPFGRLLPKPFGRTRLLNEVADLLNQASAAPR